jgi:hypothetical protein
VVMRVNPDTGLEGVENENDGKFYAV